MNLIEAILAGLARPADVYNWMTDWGRYGSGTLADWLGVTVEELASSRAHGTMADFVQVVVDRRARWGAYARGVQGVYVDSHYSYYMMWSTDWWASP